MASIEDKLESFDTYDWEDKVNIVLTARDVIEQRTKAMDDLHTALKLILPLAKGYARQNNVGNNLLFVFQAEETISSVESEHPLMSHGNYGLVEALIAISNGDARNTPKTSECLHGKYGYEHCELCYQDFAEEALRNHYEELRWDN
jgi:hypothetical protein